MARVLIVEDEPNMRKVLVLNLNRDGHSIVDVATLQAASAAWQRQDFDVILTDQKLPDGEGLELLKSVMERSYPSAVVLLTAYGSVELAVETMRKGAFDFLTKPFSTENLRAVIQRAAEHADLRRENYLLRSAVGSLEGQSELKGRGAKMQALKLIVERAGPTDTTVLISGETGTGKELVARALHKASRRSGRPLISVNCAAFPETLLESELFGHEKGSFTGADRTRYGLFETAHLGTLFLDEAGEMSPTAQAKLLRVIAEGTITRVGSTVSRKVDVRVLVASHRDLLKEVEAGRFRQDLYYRLAIFPIQVPPLRERSEDIPELVDVLLTDIAKELKVPKPAVHPEVLRQLCNYTFPGNVRELRNLLERACILNRSLEIDFLDIPSVVSSPVQDQRRGLAPLDLLPSPGTFNLRSALALLERTIILKTLQQTGGAKAEAARRLGISKSDLAYKLGKYNQAKDSVTTEEPAVEAISKS